MFPRFKDQMDDCTPSEKEQTAENHDLSYKNQVASMRTKEATGTQIPIAQAVQISDEISSLPSTNLGTVGIAIVDPPPEGMAWTLQPLSSRHRTKRSTTKCALVAVLLLLFGFIVAAGIGCNSKQCFARQQQSSPPTDVSPTVAPTSAPSAPKKAFPLETTKATASPLLLAQSRVTPHNATAGERFGIAVSIAGDWMAVGAHQSPVANFTSTGSTFLFHRSRGVWKETQQLVPSDHRSDLRFGRDVALADEGTLVVGAYFDDHAGRYTGSAYVFQLVEGSTAAESYWEETAKIIANDASADSLFGGHVAILDSSTLFVTAKNEANKTGCVYVFRKLDGIWTQHQKIRTQNASPGNRFGSSLAVSGNILVVGAERADTSEVDSGSTFVFLRASDGIWRQHQQLTGLDTIIGDSFGFSVAIWNDLIAVGAIGEADQGTNGGSVYIFRRMEDGMWEQQQKLSASSTATRARLFGFTIAFGQGVLVVGSKIGVDKADSGAGYVFRWDESTGLWNEHLVLSTKQAGGGDVTPTPRVGLSGNTIIVGSGNTDSPGRDNAGVLLVYRL